MGRARGRRKEGEREQSERNADGARSLTTAVRPCLSLRDRRDVKDAIATPPSSSTPPIDAEETRPLYTPSM